MRRPGLAGLAVTVSVAVLLIALAGCGSSSSSTTTVGSGGSGSAGRSASTATTTSRATSPTTTSSQATTTSPTTTTSPATTTLPPATTPPATTTSRATTTPGAGGLGLPHATLSVKPTTGDPTSVLHFSFQAPAASGRQGATEASYTLSAVGPHGSGCVGAETMALPAVTRGQNVTAALGPSTSGGRWCAGTYTARADELERPVCSGGQMCPQFARLVAVVGPVTFRITP